MKALIACASLLSVYAAPVDATERPPVQIGVICNSPETADTFEFYYLFDPKPEFGGLQKIAAFVSSREQWCRPGRVSETIDSIRVDGLNATRTLLLNAYLNDDGPEPALWKIGLWNVAEIPSRLRLAQRLTVVDIELRQIKLEDGTPAYFILHKQVRLNDMLLNAQ